MLLRRPVVYKSTLVRPLINSPFAMNRFSTTSDPEEVVEDSEPERVRLRNQSRTTIRSTRSPLDTHLVASENCQQQQSFSDGGLQTLATTVTETVDLNPPSGGEAVKLSLSRPTTSIAVLEAINQGEPRTNKIVNFSKFAFTSSSKRQVHSIGVPNSRSITSSSNTTRTAPKKTHLMMSLSPSDFARVSRCICCDTSWTTRKTAAQKMDHIQRCARKHGYDEETVRILIKKENSTNAVEKCISGNPKATTLLEDVIQETAPKKKRNTHRSAGNLVASGSASRKTILARARNIITTPSPDEMPSSSIDVTESTLHHVHGSSTRPMWADRQEAPPTQAFMASKLAQKRSTTLFSATNQDEEDISLSTSSSSSQSPSPKQVKLRSKDVCLENSPSVITSADVRHMESAEETNTPKDLSATPKKTPAKRGRPKLKKSELPSIDDTDSLPDLTRVSCSRTSKAPPSAKMESEFRQEWESFMNNCIRQDQDLNLRILRYEPIDLSVFLKLARLYSPHVSDRKLTLNLRDFLDKQAIHFYEANPRR